MFIGISLCSCCTYVYFAYFDIGFVLRKKRPIRRGVSTSVEGVQGEATDLGVVGVGEDYGLRSHDENLVAWYLLLTIYYLRFNSNKVG